MEKIDSDGSTDSTAANKSKVIKSALIFLGTGCSSAVPNVMCLLQPSDPPCKVCAQALSIPPEKNPNYRCNTSLLIDYCQSDGNHKYILIDVGKTFREQVLRWFPYHKIPHVDSIILTHEHADAVLGLDDVRVVQPFSPTNDIDPTPIYVSQHSMDSLAAKFPYLVKKKLKEGQEIRRVAQLDWRIIESSCNIPFVASGLQFVPLPVMHGEDYVCLGYLFGRKNRIAYISDVSRFPESTEYVISKSGAGQLDLLILDTLYKNGSHNTHFCFPQTLEAVKRLSPKRGPFGGAVDMIVVQQVDGSLKSSPWYVRFGKFQGVLKTKEKVVNITVNGVAAGFHMYLDHKGEAYFLNEVDGEEQEVGVCHSSSGEDTDKLVRSKRVMKSEGYEVEVKQPSSARLADGRDECKREFGAWSSSRRARILGLVFGSRSFNERMSQGSPEDEELKRARLLERAEIAADLLELKWSTTLATKKPKKNYALSSFLDEENPRESSIVSDKQEHDNDLCETANGTVITDCPKDIVGPPELISEVKSPMKYSIFVAQEPSDSMEFPGTKENAGGVGDDLSSKNPDKNNVILNPDSLIGIQLVTHDSVDTEMPDVIHPTDVVITRTEEDENTNMEDAHVSGSFSRQNSSCSSCISEEEVVEPEVTTTIVEEEAAECSPDSIDQGHQIDNITISDLDNSKLSAESTSPHSISGSPCGDGHSPQSNDVTYESFSSFDNSAQLKVANHLDEHVGILDAVSPTQKSAHLSKSDKDISVTDGTKLSEELRGDPVSSSAGDLSSKTWGIWPFTFKRSRSMKSSKPVSRSPRKSQSCSYPDGATEQDSNDGKHKPKGTRTKVKTVIPTSQQLASLNLKEGRNEVTFTFSTAMLGDQEVDAKIYVWKWNARVVISDVDGTITRSDVLGQVMPLVGMDWSHIGVTQLFSAIKENGYHLLFLSARSISQAYHTRQFLFNLKQNGQALPEGPVVISPDGLFPSLFREVIRRAPHEFKIACLEDIKACFPPDCNPFYAGFGNRDTDEFSYLKVGIPKGKIFIINPKGEVAVHRRLDTKSYTSLHSLVNDIFPPTSTTEQEDFNSWNFWKLPPPTM